MFRSKRRIRITCMLLLLLRSSPVYPLHDLTYSPQVLYYQLLLQDTLAWNCWCIYRWLRSSVDSSRQTRLLHLDILGSIASSAKSKSPIPECPRSEASPLALQPPRSSAWAQHQLCSWSPHRIRRQQIGWEVKFYQLMPDQARWFCRVCRNL